MPPRLREIESHYASTEMPGCTCMNVTVRKSATASQQQLTSKSGYDHIHVHPVFSLMLKLGGIEQLLSAAAVAAATALSCMQQLDADRGQAIC